MKLQIMSDLHLEFEPFRYRETDADVVILAGDIGVKAKGVEWAMKIDKPVIYVMGNHEYYGSSLPRQLEKCQDIANGSNVHFLENDIATIDGVNFFGCTLWTDFELHGSEYASKVLAGRHMNDYQAIRSSGTYSKLHPNKTQELSIESQKWLDESLKEHEGETNVVVTHHLPSEKSCSSEYKSSNLNPCYASNLEALILDRNPALWVHGHTHDAFDYHIDKTRIICNPKGYYDQNFDFYPKLIIEV